jgi:hypothetical protein
MGSECRSIKSNTRTEFSTINNIGMHIYSIFWFGLVLENKRAKKSSERASFVSSRWFRSWQWRPFRLRNAAQKQILNTTINIWRSEYVGDTTGRGGGDLGCTWSRSKLARHRRLRIVSKKARGTENGAKNTQQLTESRCRWREALGRMHIRRFVRLKRQRQEIFAMSWPSW